jgi:predicted nucleic acid-binding Zn finger protein
MKARIFTATTGEHFVESGTVPGTYYLLRGGNCSCVAGQFRRAGRKTRPCRHVQAVGAFANGLQRLDSESERGHSTGTIPKGWRS